MFIRIKKGGIKEAVIGRRLGQGLLCLILVGLMGSGAHRQRGDRCGPRLWRWGKNFGSHFDLQ